MASFVTVSLLVCLASVLIEQSKQQDEEDFSVYPFFEKELCQCDDDSIARFQQCLDNFNEQIDKWFYEELNQCENLTETIESGPIANWAPKLCAQEETIKKKCSDRMFIQIQDQSWNSDGGKYGDDVKEKARVALNCLQAILTEYQDDPDVCVKPEKSDTEK